MIWNISGKFSLSNVHDAAHDDHDDEGGKCANDRNDGGKVFVLIRV